MRRTLDSLLTVRRSDEAAARESLALELAAEARGQAALGEAQGCLDRAEDALREASGSPVSTAREHGEREAYAARLRRQRAKSLAARDAAGAIARTAAARVETAREVLTQGLV